MTRTRIAAGGIAVLAALTLVACSSGGTSTSVAAQPQTAEQVAAQLGATDVSPMVPPTLYAYSEATATLHGQSVDIATFRTAQLRDSWVKVASQFSGIQQEGPLYVVADG